ncbi:hypothetical protein IWQ54_004786 [Labrenzia sp. EL_195]|nr:hypothetical protein [Labrenzia sp. EL_195]
MPQIQCPARGGKDRQLNTEERQLESIGQTRDTSPALLNQAAFLVPVGSASFCRINGSSRKLDVTVTSAINNPTWNFRDAILQKPGRYENAPFGDR